MISERLKRLASWSPRIVLTRLVTVAAISTAMVSTVSLVSVSNAQAGYYWGCTYSWEHVCFGRDEATSNLITMDQQAAWEIIERAPQNGYPRPSNGHPEKDVCGGVWSDTENRQAVGWVCSWKYAVQTYEGIVGQPLIGTAIEYNGISLYQASNEL